MPAVTDLPVMNDTGPRHQNHTMELPGMGDVFSQSHLVHAISGGAASSVAITVFFPLETVHTRLQVDKEAKVKNSPAVMADIVKAEGILALYRGWFPVVSSLCISNFVYFYVFHSQRAMFYAGGSGPSALTDLMLAFIAGFVTVLLTSPLWTVNTRLKLQGAKLKTKSYRDFEKARYSGVIDCLYKIIKEEGAWALWRGAGPALVLTACPAIQFMVYETLKRRFQIWLAVKALPGLIYFLMGAISKMISTCVTYPMQVVQSKLMAGFAAERRIFGIRNTLKDIIRTHGISGLYRGLEAKLSQTVLTAALMFLCYEQIASFFFSLTGVQKPVDTS